MSLLSRKLYQGTQRKLVLSFDVGTTFSGISYSILEPGQEPGIKSVTRFPAQDRISGASKIPTIIYYDKAGRVCAVGAEATRDGIDIEAIENGWVKAEWFKLHLRNKTPNGTAPKDNDAATRIYPLPPGKRAVDVLADFLRYLNDCAAQYIKDTHLNGPSLWDSLENEINYVLAHPNGWEGNEQSKMREAAFIAGLIPDKNSSRLTFVTEGEASLHFCISTGILSETDMKDNHGFIIVDAGGGTIDISAYSRKLNEETMVFEEIAPSQCLLNGSIYVNLYAKRFLTGLLSNSAFADDIGHIVNAFEKSSKVRFKTDKDPQYIKFWGTRDNDALYNIKFGQLKIEGSDVAGFFRPAIDAIVEAILEQQQHIIHTLSHVLFVGGFSANDWLFNSVSKILKEKGMLLHVARPEEHVSKAVADGAMSFFLDHSVQTRMSKKFYGISNCSHHYDPGNPQHRQRSQSMHFWPDGMWRIPNVFTIILPKNTQVSEGKLFRHAYSGFSVNMSALTTLNLTISSYIGRCPNPEWNDIDKDNYVSVCTIAANLSSIPITRKINPQGNIYYYITYDVVLFFGLTEIKAQIAWTNSEGKEMRYVFQGYVWVTSTLVNLTNLENLLGAPQA